MRWVYPQHRELIDPGTYRNFGYSPDRVGCISFEHVRIFAPWSHWFSDGSKCSFPTLAFIRKPRKPNAPCISRPPDPQQLEVEGFFLVISSLKLTASLHLKWMVGRRSFPFGARPIFRGYVSFRECIRVTLSPTITEVESYTK